ncbi:MAG: WecB/TagA/CpsF family glycosyltransferase [Pegethrix bostrychoides GSE-TBD4-15B]|jgi:N-acetylglucosaminyldiphosphoundecaprenol N-acetyl-beta-D-mannosaminyltransferase|uniref:WecB/TagA/CpsF family glycosyltransferase n=1 Tax=Pegethrix bostrychoides GSE-TBD4-15B TaxID=2839662 RepID=A0A951PDX0_9CYAN|nr:WecB/TagA/CpsF family glycosyltransferase [Pegethrix bostrychoides GSE-TBD4-15B]
MQVFDEVIVLNTRFHKVTVCELIDYIVQSAQANKKTIVSNVNVRAINFARQLPWYRQFINGSDLVFCDGFGVLLGANLNGYCLCGDHRMTCPDYIEALATACERDHISLFLLAGQPGVTDRAIEKLKQVAPNLRVEGHHGYFAKTGAENDQVIEQINQFKPDVLYVGFGMPAQERWILDNLERIETRVFLPLGACLDFYTGSVYRGPRWLTDRGFEWVTRLVTEPRRLWERYLLGNMVFLYHILTDYLRHRVRPQPSKLMQQRVKPR